MKNFKTILMGLLLLALLAPIASAAPVAKKPTITMTAEGEAVDPATGQGSYYLDAFVFEITGNERIDLGAERRAAEAQAQNQLSDDPDQREAARRTISTSLLSKVIERQYFSVSGAKVAFYRIDLITQSQVPLSQCAAVTASNFYLVDGQQQYDSAGNLVYYARCALPRDLYAGSCITVVAQHTPDAASSYQYSLTSDPTTFCDRTLGQDAGVSLKTTFNAFLAGISDQDKIRICVPIFILFGLLLASMYFGGKTPISLLDIATPKLPSPKGIAAAGQVLGPFGYTEMKKFTNAANRTALGAIGALRPAIAAGAGFNSVLYNRLADRARSEVPRTMTAGDKFVIGEKQTAVKFNEAVALAAVRANYYSKDFGVTHADVERLVGKHIGRWDEKDYAAFGKIINQLNKGSESDRRIADLVRAVGEGIRQYQTLEVLTAHPEVGRRSGWVQFVQTALAKTMGPNRFMLLGVFASSSFDSAVRSLRVGSRFVGASAGQLLDTATGGWARRRAGEYYDHRRAEEQAKGRPEGLLTRMAGSFVSAAPEKVILGGLHPILDKLSHDYRQLRDEAYRDMMRFILSSALEKEGTRFTLSEAEIAELGYKGTFQELLEKMKYRESEELKRFERDFQGVLHKADLSAEQKLREIMRIAERENISLDHGFYSEFEKLQAIDSGRRAEELKWLELREHLQNVIPGMATRPEERTEALPEGKFKYLIGQDRLSASEMWEAYNVRRYIWEAENGFLKGDKKGEEGRLINILESSYFNIINRITSLDPVAQHPHFNASLNLPAFMLEEAGHTPEERKRFFKGRTDEAYQLISSQLTEEGRAMHQELVRYLKAKGESEEVERKALKGMFDGSMAIECEVWKNTGKFVAKLGEFKVPLYPVTAKGLAATVEGKKALFYLESTEEVPTRKEWWKVDMQRRWDPVLTTRNVNPIGQWVEYRFHRANVAAHDAEVEREIEQRLAGIEYKPEERLALTQKKWVEKLLMKDMHEFMNSTIGYGVYAGGQEHARFNTKVLAAFLAGALTDKYGRREIETTLEKLETFDPSKPNSMRWLRDLYQEYRPEVLEFMKKPLSYETVANSKFTWVKLYEGGYVPYLSGMAISAFERPLGGILGIYNPADGKYHHVDLSNVSLDPTKFSAEDTHLVSKFNFLRGLGKTKRDDQFEMVKADGSPIVVKPDGTPQVISWKTYVTELREWANRNGFEGEKVFTAVVNTYGAITKDQYSFWDMTKARMLPKREVEPGYSSQLIKFFTEKPLPEKFFGVFPRSYIKRARDTLLDFGDVVSRISFATGNQLHATSWEVTALSESYKQHLWKVAHAIHTGQYKALLDDIPSKEARDEAEKALLAVAISASKYRGAWLWAIDRNPWMAFADYGYMQRLSSGFHHGPRRQYPVDINYRPITTAAEYANFTLLARWAMEGIPLKIPFTDIGLRRDSKLGRALFSQQGSEFVSIPGARQVGDFYAAIFRTLQEELQSTPARFDIDLEHYTRPHVMSDMRMRSALTTLLNPLSAHEFQMLPLKWMQEHERFKSPTIDRFMAGKALGYGLSHASTEASFLRPGLTAYYREGPVNPGASILNMRYEHIVDPAQAQYLVYRSRGAARAYYAEIEEYKRIAMRDTIRRMVAVEPWQAHGETTRQMHGWFVNQSTALAAPFNFALNFGFPFGPFSPGTSFKEWGPKLARKAYGFYKGEAAPIQLGVDETGAAVPMETAARAAGAPPAKARKTYERAKKAGAETVSGVWASVQRGTVEIAMPWRQTKMVWCPSCGKHVQRGSICSNCSRFGSNTWVPG